MIQWLENTFHICELCINDSVCEIVEERKGGKSVMKYADTYFIPMFCTSIIANSLFGQMIFEMRLEIVLYTLKQCLDRVVGVAGCGQLTWRWFAGRRSSSAS